MPVRLSPQPPGKWHWIGTRTLSFEPDVRFPMAQYSVVVPADEISSGRDASAGKSWTFTTRRLRLRISSGRSALSDAMS